MIFCRSKELKIIVKSCMYRHMINRNGESVVKKALSMNVDDFKSTYEKGK